MGLTKQYTGDIINGKVKIISESVAKRIQSTLE